MVVLTLPPPSVRHHAAVSVPVAPPVEAPTGALPSPKECRMRTEASPYAPSEDGHIAAEEDPAGWSQERRVPRRGRGAPVAGARCVALPFDPSSPGAQPATRAAAPGCCRRGAGRGHGVPKLFRLAAAPLSMASRRSKICPHQVEDYVSVVAARLDNSLLLINDSYIACV